MARLTEFEKKRLAKYYSCSLFKLYETGDIAEEDMERVIGDIHALKIFFTSFEWKRLDKDHRVELIRKFIFNKTELLSPVTTLWLKMHLPDKRKDDKNLDETLRILYNMDHFPVIEGSVKEVDKNVITVYIELANYISLTNEQKLIINQIYKTYLSNNILEPSEKNEIRMFLQSLPLKEDKYQELIDNNFKNSKSKYVKIYIKSSPSENSDQNLANDEEYKRLANEVFNYKLNYFRKNVLMKKVELI